MVMNEITTKNKKIRSKTHLGLLKRKGADNNKANSCAQTATHFYSSVFTAFNCLSPSAALQLIINLPLGCAAEVTAAAINYQSWS